MRPGIPILLLIFIVLCSVKSPSQGVMETDNPDVQLRTLNNPAKQVDSLLKRAFECKGESPEIALEYSKTAYAFSLNFNYLNGEVNSLIALGSIYLILGNFNEAKEHAEKALKKSEEYSMKNESAKARSVLALIYHELGDYEKNAFYDFENLKYYEQIQDSIEIAITLGNIGIDFVVQKDFDRSLEYLNKSLQIAIKINDLDGVAYQYNNIANIYFDHLKDFNSALINFIEALKINYKLKNKKQEGIYLMNIGITYLELNKNDSALIYLQRANKIFVELNNKLFIADCQIAIGEYYYKVGDVYLSLKYADSAYSVAKLNGFKPELLNSVSLLNKIYVSLNNFEKAYEYVIIKHQIIDSTAFELNKKELYKMELQYNYDKEEKLKLINQQRRNFWVSFTIVCLLLIIIITILLYSRQRIKSRNNFLEKEKIQDKLNSKSKELALNIMVLIKKNEMFTDILHKLGNIEDQIRHKETKDIVQKIMKDIRNNNDSKMINEFSLRFQEVHTGFYEILLKSFPDLTQNELKLCAFLRLNMTTKDISEITGQLPLTIDKARTRLRKKLGISGSDTNLVTFLSLLQTAP